MGRNRQCKDYKIFGVASNWSETLYFDKNIGIVSVLDRLDIDITDPQCFACNWSIFDTKKTLLDYKERWEESKLEKHHFYPLSLGGEDELDNLFLLCRICHSNAPTVPMTLEKMIKWCKSMPSFIERIYETTYITMDRMMKAQLEGEEEKKKFIQWVCNNTDSLQDVKAVAKKLVLEKKMTTHGFDKVPNDAIAYSVLKLYQDAQLEEKGIEL